MLPHLMGLGILIAIFLLVVFMPMDGPTKRKS